MFFEENSYKKSTENEQPAAKCIKKAFTDVLCKALKIVLWFIQNTQFPEKSSHFKYPQLFSLKIYSWIYPFFDIVILKKIMCLDFEYNIGSVLYQYECLSDKYHCASLSKNDFDHYFFTA